MAEMPHIGHIWAFLSVDDDGNEGLCGIRTNEGWLPLVCADDARMKSLIPIAHGIARSTGKLIKLVKFHNREDIKDILPKE
jgi:hypothetical protein